MRKILWIALVLFILAEIFLSSDPQSVIMEDIPDSLKIAKDTSGFPDRMVPLPKKKFNEENPIITIEK